MHLPVLLLGLLGACAKPQSPAPAGAAAALPAIPTVWLGRWPGPEGTYLEIAMVGESYTVTISNLDGPRSFAAMPEAGSLAFGRDGVRETLRATDGDGTGMKWLAGKKDCLVVRPGEGFCRD